MTTRNLRSERPQGQAQDRADAPARSEPDPACPLPALDREGACAQSDHAPVPARPDDVLILVVEDSQTQRMRMERTLSRAGYATVGAPDAFLALELLATRPVTLVVSDIVMPGMDGYELCRAVRRSEVRAQTPVILLTTLHDPLDIIRGVSCGANAFVTKPYRDEFLLERVRYALENLGRPSQREEDGPPCIVFRGRDYPLEYQSPSALDLLVSVYEEAIARNAELADVNAQLTRSKEELEQLARELKAEMAQRIEIEAALRASEERYRELSSTDPLTGLDNRRNFFSVGAAEVRRSARHGHDLCVVMADIDHFKAINDTFGHAAGDAALQATARILRSRLRTSDILARYGGEEFVMLLPETDGPGGAALSENVRRAMAEMAVNTPAGQVRLTVSLGVSALTPAQARTLGESALSDCIARADQALYLAKRTGRDKVVVA